jgi:putative MFS transporter
VTSSEPSALTPITPYQRRLFWFLGVATFFEGFDYMALSQILPSLRATYGLSAAQGGRLVSFIGFGAILAYALIRHADVVGRRRVLSYTILGYTTFSLLSACAQNAAQFGVAQLLARVFLLAEYAVSMVYIAEEFPKDRRGFAVGMIQGLSSFGAIACAGLVPLLLRTPLGFRAVFVVGAVPLVIVWWLRRGVRETARFEELARTPRPRQSLFHIFRTPHGKRIPLLAAIWALTYLCTYVMVTFWKDFVVSERGFTDQHVSFALMIAALVSLPLVFASGKLLDVIGRKRGAAVIFCTASASTLLAYLAHGFWLLTLGMIGGIFSASAVLPVLTSFTLELFPTELRADAFAWSNNLLGRTGYVLGPWLVGLGADRHGYGPTVAATSIFPLIALALILTRLPETSGKELEETSAL